MARAESVTETAEVSDPRRVPPSGPSACPPAGSTSRVEELVRRLDCEAEVSYEARAELVGIGAEAVPAIIEGLDSLGVFGQLTAIEVFDEVADPRCGPALIGLLDSDNPDVREWSAHTLGVLGIGGAVEPLRRAHRACQARGDAPDLGEPIAIRGALTSLGARIPVVPPLTARLRIPAGAVGRIGPCWPAARYTEVVNDLADHGQLILYAQFWQQTRERTIRVPGPDSDRWPDWTAPWNDLVEEARTWSLLEALDAPTGGDVLVSPEWIDSADLRP
ncbi:HEAT repeat domain-containing protein [Streptomyces sp. NPDC049040]|uniref:HEAT repeat domain-containing protein n=1 Tax=Streptomyces sp. NPDC049040 TaxID=3365593 RepID=UPI003721AC7B